MSPFVYIHIPKTGGTSVRSALRIDESFHFTALRMKHRIGNYEWERSFKFCFVRNPWDRLVSWFYFNRDHLRYEGYDHKDDISNIDKNITFDEWIKDGCQHNWARDWLLPEQENCPLRQFTFIMDENNNCLMDFVGRFENLQKDFDYVLDKINFNVQLPKLNVTSGRNDRHYREFYTPETRKIVGQMFEEEIDYFEYRY
jgi:hypothetical protein